MFISESLFLFRSGGAAAVFQLLLIETIDEAERDVPLGVIFVLIEAEAVDACPFVVIERVEKVAGGEFDVESVAEEALAKPRTERPIGVEAIDALVAAAVVVEVKVEGHAERQPEVVVRLDVIARLVVIDGLAQINALKLGLDDARGERWRPRSEGAAEVDAGLPEFGLGEVLPGADDGVREGRIVHKEAGDIVVGAGVSGSEVQPLPPEGPLEVVRGRGFEQRIALLVDEAALIIRPAAEVGERGPIRFGGEGEGGVEVVVGVGGGGGGEELDVRVAEAFGGVHEVGVVAGDTLVAQSGAEGPSLKVQRQLGVARGLVLSAPIVRLGQSAGINEVLSAAIDAAVFGAEREREGVGEVPIGREFGGIDVVVGQQLRVGQGRIPGHELAHGLELFVARGDIVGVDRCRKSLAPVGIIEDVQLEVRSAMIHAAGTVKLLRDHASAAHDVVIVGGHARVGARSDQLCADGLPGADLPIGAEAVVVLSAVGKLVAVGGVLARGVGFDSFDGELVRAVAIVAISIVGREVEALRFVADRGVLAVAEALAEATVGARLDGEARGAMQGVDLDHRRHVRAILSAGVGQQFDLANVLHVEHAQLRTTAHTSVVEVVDRRASAKNGDAALVADDARDLPQEVGKRVFIGQHGAYDGRRQHAVAIGDVRSGGRDRHFAQL